LLNELASSLESLEAQHAALFQFLKDNGTVTDDQFAPYLAQAGKSSDVRWRAARIRLESLFSRERQNEEKLRENEQHQADPPKAPIQTQEKQAKPEKDGVGGNPGSQSADPPTNREVAGKSPASENNKKQDEPAASEDKGSIQASKNT
jgi:hypothetical protein